MLPTPGFHHLHLNSVDPDAAIDLYTRQFPSTHEGQLGRLSGAESPNNVMVLFTKVDSAAADRAAERDLAFRLACHRRAQAASRPIKSRPEVKLLPLYTTRRRRLGADQQRHLAEHRQRARPDQGADRRGARRRASSRPGGGGFAYMAGPDNALVEYRRRLSGRALQPRAPVAGGAVLRAALVPEAPQRAGARGLRRHRRRPRPTARCRAAPTAPGRRSTARGCSARRAPGSSSATWC